MEYHIEIDNEEHEAPRDEFFLLQIFILQMIRGRIQ